MGGEERVLELATPVGPARAYVTPAVRPVGTLLLGHGAGGGSTARDLQALTALAGSGVTVVRVDQPWRVAGRRVAPAPSVLDRAWTAAVAALTAPGGPARHGSLLLGGRSAGARVACRTAGTLGARGVVALAFPLHPPGRPDRSRLAELAAVEVPLLVLQGERDPFGAPAEFPPTYDVRPVPGADHGMRVAAKAVPNQREVLAALVAAVAGWAHSL